MQRNDTTIPAEGLEGVYSSDYRWAWNTVHRAEQSPQDYTEKDDNQRDIFERSPTKNSCSRTNSEEKEVQVKKLVRLNTRKSYTWLKNNVLAEDIEGYALLIAQVLSRVPTARYNSKQVESLVLAVVGVYNAEPVKTFDVFMVHNSQNDVESSVPIYIFKQLCSEPTQAAGFHMHRTIRKPDTVSCRWYTHLLLNEDRNVVEKIYPHLFPNDLCSHSDQRGKEHDSSLSRVSHVALTVLSNIFEECQCDQSSLAMLIRIARLGFVVCENVHIRTSLRHDIERSLTGTAMRSATVIKKVLLVGPAASSYLTLQASIMQWLSQMVSCFSSEDQTVTDVFVGCIFPGMSIRRPNPATDRKIWDILTQLTFSERAKLYDRAFRASRHWSRQATEASIYTETSSLRILRRLSRENVKHLGRKLGKLITRCPLHVTKVVLDQIEAYPNMIQPVVDSLKYCGSLSLDVLLYHIIHRLSSSKIKVKSDGQHVMTWFSSLSAFTGLLCRHFSRVDLHAIIYYIVGTLKDGQNFDMLVFSEIIKSMTGIQIIRDVSDSSMISSSSGPYLRSTSNKVSIGSSEHSRKCLLRLRSVLSDVHGDANLASSLLVLLAKSRQVIVSSEASQQLKFISQWYDESHHVLIQYISCLHMIFSEGECIQLLPKAGDLAEKYGIEPAIIYHIFRRSNFGSISSPAACTSSDSKQASEESCHFMLNKNWERVMPSELGGKFSREMYNTFWQMVLSDIFVPNTLYENAFRKYSGRNNSRQTSEDDLHNGVLQKLKSEHAELTAALVSCKHKLKEAAKSWVLEEDPSVVARCILQYMVYPRLKMSGVDALYAAHFIDLLHEMDIPRFNILFYYDRIFRDLPQLIHCCSQRESSQVGVYMSHTFSRILRWRHESTYDHECMSFKSLRLPRDSQLVQMSYANYITLLYNWHLKFTKSILPQLESDDYMELRTLLEVLVRVVNHFPILRSHGMHLQKRMEKIQSHEQRGDIQTIAKRYVALLGVCARTWH